MKSRILVALIGVMIFMVGCSSNEKTNLLSVGKNSDDIVGENYKEVVLELENKGFKNIETKIVDDLITGWLTKDGEIEEIEIDGKKEFESEESFKKTAKIIITYHTFPKDEKETTSVKKEETEVLNLENSKELSDLVSLKDPMDPSVEEFVSKFAGKTIEINANIASVMMHENKKTRFDFLIYYGDFSETSVSGPNFKFEDVNISDLNLIGGNIPENIVVGQNIHIKAIIKEYDVKSGLLLLKPISTEIK